MHRSLAHPNSACRSRRPPARSRPAPRSRARLSAATRSASSANNGRVQVRRAGVHQVADQPDGVGEDPGAVGGGRGGAHLARSARAVADVVAVAAEGVVAQQRAQCDRLGLGVVAGRQRQCDLLLAGADRRTPAPAARRRASPPNGGVPLAAPRPTATITGAPRRPAEAILVISSALPWRRAPSASRPGCHPARCRCPRTPGRAPAGRVPAPRR